MDLLRPADLAAFRSSGVTFKDTYERHSEVPEDKRQKFAIRSTYYKSLTA